MSLKIMQIYLSGNYANQVAIFRITQIRQMSLKIMQIYLISMQIIAKIRYANQIDALKIMQIYLISGNYANQVAIFRITFMQIRQMSLKIMQIYLISGNYANQVAIFRITICKLDRCHLKLCKFI